MPKKSGRPKGSKNRSPVSRLRRAAKKNCHDDDVKCHGRVDRVLRKLSARLRSAVRRRKSPKHKSGKAKRSKH